MFLYLGGRKYVITPFVEMTLGIRYLDSESIITTASFGAVSSSMQKIFNVPLVTYHILIRYNNTTQYSSTCLSSTPTNKSFRLSLFLFANTFLIDTSAKQQKIKNI